MRIEASRLISFHFNNISSLCTYHSNQTKNLAAALNRKFNWKSISWLRIRGDWVFCQFRLKMKFEQNCNPRPCLSSSLWYLKHLWYRFCRSRQSSCGCQSHSKSRIISKAQSIRYISIGLNFSTKNDVSYIVVCSEMRMRWYFFDISLTIAVRTNRSESEQNTC